eukprot:8380520-Pyramimonas_sp.AAC.1
MRGSSSRPARRGPGTPGGARLTTRTCHGQGSAGSDSPARECGLLRRRWGTGGEVGEGEDD